MPANSPIYLPYDDYAQSANTLFHFMKKQEYLNSILRRGAIIPRYCVETIDYLSIQNGTHLFNEVAILQKCFCDIPFHKLADSFAVNGVGDVYESLSKDERADLEKNNTHFAYYGEYAVAFSKSWGEKKHLQPVHYLNKDSQYAKDFSALFSRVFLDDDIPGEYSQDIINRLAYIKPLRGIMKRKITRSDSSSATIEIYKNFHDEREWRYVPNAEVLTALNTESIIANPYIIPSTKVRHLGTKFPLEEQTNITEFLVGPAVETVPITLDVDGNRKTITLLRSRLKDKVILHSEPDTIVAFNIAFLLGENKHTLNFKVQFEKAKSIREVADSFSIAAALLAHLYNREDNIPSEDGNNGDTDSKPMYISFSAFQTSEEAKQESETIMQHESIYVNALTSNAYITQYYEEQ